MKKKPSDVWQNDPWYTTTTTASSSGNITSASTYTVPFVYPENVDAGNQYFKDLNKMYEDYRKSVESSFSSYLYKQLSEMEEEINKKVDKQLEFDF